MTAADANAERSARARLSLDGLSIGDGFGQRFFIPWTVESATSANLPEAPWHYTDDTEMAMAIVQVLERYGEIEQNALAQTFANRYLAEPGRGYGAGAHELLRQIADGADWRLVSRELFGGQGSFGNGGAMRVGPLGAWFADDVKATIENALRSSEITHAHIEGQAGAIAVALAAGWAWRWNQSDRSERPEQMLEWIAELLPESEVAASVAQVSDIPLDAWAFDVAREFGCGDQVSAQDTVAYCLWMSAAHLTDYCGAMWTAARVGGDVDTTCAIIGSIVAMSVGNDTIPAEWQRHRESLNW
ncbi:MAG: ADP-ribosylglycohydrolase family protein [Rhodopirellula sp.]|nr:ADP-ribosylglycohydrolase family protein [Rhodopirellula sp.]